MIKRILYQIVFALVIICPPLLVAQENSANKYSVMNTRELSEQTVAEVGPLKITVNEFLNNYEFGPAFVKRMKESRKRHLEFMIYEKLLALEGYNNKLDTLDDVKLFLNDIRGDLAGEKLYRSLIWDKLIIPDSEITNAAEKQNTSLILKWIFVKDMQQISSVYQELNNGVPFDTLFIKQFRDSVSFDDRYLETDRLNLERKNPALASIVDSIPAGKFSGPIKTEDGWYIVKIENILKSVLQTQSESGDQRYKLEALLKKEKADSAADILLEQMFSKENPVIVRPSFNAIAYHLGSKYLQPFLVKDWKISENIHPKYFNDRAFNLFKGFNDTLIKMNSEPISIRMFINWYSTREPYIKLILTSKTGFLNSVQGVIWRMLRDFMITRMAEADNFHKDEEVQLEMKWWKDKVVYSKMKQIIASSVKINEDALLKYYNANKEDYADNSVLKKYEEVKEDVRNDYYVYEYTKRIVNKVLTLKNKYKININEDLLNYLPVSEEDNPRSINLYSVKKGGTFVRPVYPIIDNEWQFWN